MQARGLALGLLTLTAALTGCGGGGSGPSSTAAIASPFAGRWAGSWNDAGGDYGTLELTVGTDGKLSGSVFDQAAGMQATVSGSVAAAGHFQATETYPGIAPIALSGTVSLSTNDHLGGDLQEQMAGRPLVTGGFALVRAN